MCEYAYKIAVICTKNCSGRSQTTHTDSKAKDKHKQFSQFLLYCCYIDAHFMFCIYKYIFYTNTGESFIQL